jgi:hypothetical protein
MKKLLGFPIIVDDTLTVPEIMLGPPLVQPVEVSSKTLRALRRLLCASPEKDCEDCNDRIVCDAELAGVCVPVYAAAREMGIELID